MLKLALPVLVVSVINKEWSILYILYLKERGGKKNLDYSWPDSSVNMSTCIVARRLPK